MFPRNPARRAEPCEPALPSRADIARLIESHLSYATAIASEVLKKLPPELEAKDIRGAAELGLVEAANSFDPSRGVQFKTFAYYRIKGAIYDALRKMGWYPKSQYQQMRFEMAANEYLKDFSTQPPRSGTPEAELQDLKDLAASLVTCYMLSLDSMSQEPEDSQGISAEEAAVRDEMGRHLRRSLAQLPDTNRRVLELCYFDGLTLEETGRRLGLSKSWVCRLHAKSLELLRKQLDRNARQQAANATATFPATLR